MKLLTFFTASLLVGLAFTAPTSNEDDNDKVTVTKAFFPDSLAVYTGQHDIVSIFYPLNALNFGEESDDGGESEVENSFVFFVEADTNEKGERVDQGLFVLKNEVATKLLDNGRDAGAGIDESKTVYFAAKDGLYTYNVEKNSADKYGTLTDDLIGIVKPNTTEEQLYVLTADHVLYKVTEEGTKKEKIESVVNAKQIVLDYSNNLFYQTTDNQVFVLVDDEVKKVEGLPANPNSITLLKPLFVLENGIPLVVDSKSYIAYENGTIEQATFEFQVKPTAYSLEATLIHYYAYDKKIYKYNILEILFSEIFTEMKEYLEDKTDSIQSIATRSRSEFVNA